MVGATAAWLVEKRAGRTGEMLVDRLVGNWDGCSADWMAAWKAA